MKNSLGQSNPPPTYSIVIPVYNESQVIAHCIDRVVAVMESLGQPFELIFVDDGSQDQSFSILAKRSEPDKRIKVVSFSRNFGHQAALFAGLEYARGQAVVSMDADLQHPPELIPEMIRLWQAGNEVVYTIKREAQTFSPVRRLAMTLGYAIIRKTTGLDISFGQSDFRLLDRSVVDALVQMPERRKFLRGLVSWVGFKQIGIPYEPAARFAGYSKYSYSRLFRLAFDGIFSFSIVPLRALLVFGFLAAALAFLYAFVSLMVYFFSWNLPGFYPAPPGWLSTIVVALFLGGTQLMALGLIGEYLGRALEGIQHRPAYIVRRRIGFEETGDTGVGRSE